jgi:hypothetical protein
MIGYPGMDKLAVGGQRWNLIADAEAIALNGAVAIIARCASCSGGYNSAMRVGGSMSTA